MADQEKVAETLPRVVPIVEVGATAAYPHPKLEGMPEGVVGHPGEHLEHEAIIHDGKIIAVPNEGYGQDIKTTPSEQDVERLLKEGEGETGHWLGAFLKGKLKGKS